MNILYLDFDGVLHHYDVMCWPEGEPVAEMLAPGRTLFEWAPLLEGLLAPRPDVRIVLSTHWVLLRGGAEAATAALTPGLRERVVGATYRPGEMKLREFVRAPRGVQVIQDVLYRRPAHWLALDDEKTSWPEESRGHVVFTDSRTGLSEMRVRQEVAEWLEALS